MDQIAAAWAWICQHPAGAAWALFGALSVLVGVYRLKEAELKAFVASTETKADDKLVAALDALVGVFEVLKLFVPHLIARPPAPKEPKP